ncbi:hypothetical protein GCM10011351_31570 [Paraliobacillus quinghaiensis]|uniref:Replicative helicase inhibitor G39P N-terminal domain-containing protein n=1 Tax=Paraliobacillus quinghaiensis TaxID=470815 RepID=A0A917TXQ3_9BACI|nr:hypothetical protein [Paraliobacillus quinghaiensis]GGM43294.1 hypothetical protein GCM10011351_31570 [Paraliobacillus quinghaiensis]
MNNDQALEVLGTIAELYPKFDISKRKVAILLPKLKKMDYSKVMKKLSAYAAEHPYAPTLSEIAVYPPETNIYLEQQRPQWEKEAALVSEETKIEFKQQLNTLFREMSL